MIRRNILNKRSVTNRTYHTSSRLRNLFLLFVAMHHVFYKGVHS
jgi:hypothetical protein